MAQSVYWICRQHDDKFSRTQEVETVAATNRLPLPSGVPHLVQRRGYCSASSHSDRSATKGIRTERRLPKAKRYAPMDDGLANQDWKARSGVHVHGKAATSPRLRRYSYHNIRCDAHVIRSCDYAGRRQNDSTRSSR